MAKKKVKKEVTVDIIDQSVKEVLKLQGDIIELADIIGQVNDRIDRIVSAIHNSKSVKDM